jgi:tRNA G10  N-methylase Trm11
VYLYLTSRSEPEKELINTECLAITDVIPDENGIAIRANSVYSSGNKKLYTDVSRSAYIKMCIRIISYSINLADLYEQLKGMGLHSDGFRVSVVKIPRNIKSDSQEIMHQIGARIEGIPDLKNPKFKFLVVITERDIWLGEVISESDNTWDEHSHKIHQYSSSLPTRFARAVVNLVATPGDRIIDPCCGSGTILIEAASIGMKAVGCDNNPLMATASAENVRHFNLDVPIAVADARNIKGRFDAVVTDLPYGRNCPLDDSLCYEILTNLRNLAPKLAIVAGADISQLLSQIGYGVKHVISVPKHSMIRYVHVAES